MRLIIILLALVLFAAPAQADAWAVPPQAYAHSAIARCAQATTAKLQPNEARYEICADQMTLFTAALSQARAENRLLIVDFGATWCPWCRSLQGQLQSPALFGTTGGRVELAAAFQVLEIGLSTLHAGRRIDVPSGHAVLGEVLAAAKGAKLRSVPFLAVIDPNDATKTVVRNLDDFEQAGAGTHDAALVRAFLAEAHDHIRQGATAPTEPGWLRKKFTRMWQRAFGG